MVSGSGGERKLSGAILMGGIQYAVKELARGRQLRWRNERGLKRLGLYLIGRTR
jgi:hypothetical protein